MELELIKQQAADLFQVSIDKVQLKRKQKTLYDWETFDFPKAVFLLGISTCQRADESLTLLTPEGLELLFIVQATVTNLDSTSHLAGYYYPEQPITKCFKPDLFVTRVNNSSNQYTLLSFYEIVVMS